MGRLARAGWHLHPGGVGAERLGQQRLPRLGSRAAVDLLSDVLGIDLAAPGGSELSISIPDTGLSQAEGTRPTQHGTVASSWEHDASGTSLTTTIPVNTTAVVEDGEPPLHYVERIARTKATLGWQRMLAARAAAAPVLAADTEVVLDGEFSASPMTRRRDAMLAASPARSTRSLTAVAMRWQRRANVAVSRVERHVAQAAPREIDALRRHAASRSTRRAATRIQGRAAAFVARLDGSYSGVMGLPLAETATLLARIGCPVL